MTVNEPLTFRTSRAIAMPATLRGIEVEADETVVELKRNAEAVPLRFDPPRVAFEIAPVEPELVPALDVALVAPTAAPKPAGKLYLVARARGGLGATSFAVNLALGLQGAGGKEKRRVAIVDLDLQFGTVGSSLDLPDRGGLVALAQLDSAPDSHAVDAALQPHPNGLSVLPAPKRPIPLDAFDADRIEAVMTQLMASHDAVVVDMPPALVSWIEPLLRLADRVFMLTDLSVTSVDCARRVIDTFREDVPELQLEIVIAREKKPFFRGRIHRDVAEALDTKLENWLPTDSKRARLALDRGEPVLALAPYSAWSRSIRKIVGKLV